MYLAARIWTDIRSNVGKWGIATVRHRLNCDKLIPYCPNYKDTTCIGIPSISLFFKRSDDFLGKKLVCISPNFDPTI